MAVTATGIAIQWYRQECEARGLRLVVQPVSERQRFMDTVPMEFSALRKRYVVGGTKPEHPLIWVDQPVGTTTLNLFVDDPGDNFSNMVFAFT